MPSNYVSPGAYIKESDWSLYARSLSSTSVGFVGAFNKGDINDATLITNVSELVNQFGTPNPNTYAWYAIKNYLRSGRKAWVVRIADANVAKASVNVDSNVTYGSITSTNKNLFTFSPEMPGEAKGTEVETFDIDSYDAIALKVDGNSEQDVYLTSGIKTAQSIVNDINSQTSGLTAYVSGGKVYIKSNTNGTSSSIQIIDFTDKLEQMEISTVSGTFGVGNTVTGSSSSATGVVTKVTATTIEVNSVSGGPFTISDTLTDGTSGATCDVDAVHVRTLPYTKLGLAIATNSGTAGTNKLIVKVDGGSTQTITIIPDASTESLSKTSQQLVDIINLTLVDAIAIKLYDGTIKITTNTSGVGGSIQIDAASTADTIIGFDNSIHSGSSVGFTFLCEALNEGTWGNSCQLMISDGTLSGTFRLAVIDDGKTVEIFNNLSKTPSADNYIQNKINGVSNYITVTDNLVVTENPAYGTYSLSGGDSGISGLTDSDYVGIDTGSSKTGLQIFKNSETYMINLLTVPGISSAAVVSEMITICEDRTDCLAIIDPPQGLTPQTVVDWHNGTGVYSGSHTAFNSSYAALYWPWVKQLDSYSGLELWQPPSGYVVDRMAYTDKVAEPWYASAGFVRGRLTGILDIEYRADQGERDYLYSDGNAVNVITDFAQDGVVIWGQRTLQRAPTALDRVNVRRLMLYIAKVVSSVTRYVVFEPNDFLTWTRVKNALIPYFDWLYDPNTGRALYYYKIVCDKTTNTDLVINNNQMIVKIYIQPVKTAEMIISDIVLLPTGATVDNYVAKNI